MLIEGYYITDRNNDLYAVKGLTHPPGKVVAIPKYLWNGQAYSKVQDYQTAIYLLEKTREEYLHKNDENYGATIPAIPKTEIKTVKEPTWHLSKQHNELTRVANELYIELSQYLNLENLGGFTGSLMLGLFGSESDIDIVIYGVNAGREVYETLQELRRLNITTYLDYESAEKFLRKRRDTSEKISDWIKHEKNKVLTGVYHGKVYNFKLVPYPSEFGEGYGIRRIRRLGKVEVICEITDDTYSIFTPNIYSVNVVKVLRGPDNTWEGEFIISFRSRYAEQGRTGDRIKVHGILEEIHEKEGHSYYRILVGVDNLDYMLRT